MDLSKVYDPDDGNPGRSELDSHADTCVAGANTTPMWFTEQRVSVSPFIGEYKPLDDIPIASIATAWDNPVDGSTIILIVNEALYFGERMPYSLLCPNQLRYNGLIVNDIPKTFDTKSTHSIIIPGKLNLPLRMRGVLSYLCTRKPTEQELHACERYELMSSAPWEPQHLLLDSEDQRNASMVTYTTYFKMNPPELDLDVTSFNISCLSTHRVHALLNINASPPHEVNVIAHDTQRRLPSLKQGKRRANIEVTDLAKRWYMGTETSFRTLRATTQEGMSFVEGPLERRLRTSQAHLRFPNLNTTIYSDTFFSIAKSVCGYSCAQVFTDGYCFSSLYPLKSKGDAHYALMQFIHEVDIPKNLLTDRAPEEMHGEWGRIVKHYHIHHRTTESKSPWQNRSESEIRELKKLARHAMRTNQAPNSFWCFAVEWASRIRSLTAHDTAHLKTRTQEERVTGREQNVCLGRWLGVAFGVCQAMTYWLLTAKRTVIVRSSVSPLSDINHRDPSISQIQKDFMTKIFEADPTGTTQIEIFEDEPGDEKTQVLYDTQEADDYTPESYDEYLLAQVNLPVGDTFRKGQVIRRKRDSNGRPLGVRNTNPLLDSREYEVLFPDGSTQSYLANTIAIFPSGSGREKLHHAQQDSGSRGQ